MFSDRRHLRRWAARVLLIWLFGLAMGVANACALGESAHHRPDANAATSLSNHHHGDEQIDAAEVNCLDFCEKSSSAIPQLKVVGGDLTALAFALPVSRPVPMSDLAGPVLGRLDVDSPSLPGGPLPRIAFQRLAL
jgi:hypothetical protein